MSWRLVVYVAMTIWVYLLIEAMFSGSSELQAVSREPESVFCR